MAINENILYGLEDVKIALRTGAHTYGTAVDVYAAQMLGIEDDVSEATARGDNKVVARTARRVGANVTMRFVFKSLDVWATLTGDTSSSSSGTSSDVFTAEARCFPIVGICGKITLADCGDGDVHLWIPHAQLIGGARFQTEDENFVIPEATLYAVDDGAPWHIYQLITHSADTAVAVPPA